MQLKWLSLYIRLPLVREQIPLAPLLSSTLIFVFEQKLSCSKKWGQAWQATEHILEALEQDPVFILALEAQGAGWYGGPGVPTQKPFSTQHEMVMDFDLCGQFSGNLAGAGPVESNLSMLSVVSASFHSKHMGIAESRFLHFEIHTFGMVWAGLEI
mmetsp:Transcript_42154/g.75506  ORF Transcript_42154/g.75506 Transcript_42154/m.75506 type:complete len:156 (+) Transcript_42154:1457-1924(+)